MDGAPLTRTPPRQSWGRGPSPLGVAANPGPSVDVSFTASCAAPTGRVPGLRGAFIIASTPCSCVGVGDQHSGIVRLSESSRQCSLPYLLTYLCTVVADSSHGESHVGSVSPAATRTRTLALTLTLTLTRTRTRTRTRIGLGPLSPRKWGRFPPKPCISYISSPV